MSLEYEYNTRRFAEMVAAANSYMVKYMDELSSALNHQAKLQTKLDALMSEYQPLKEADNKFRDEYDQGIKANNPYVYDNAELNISNVMTKMEPYLREIVLTKSQIRANDEKVSLYQRYVSQSELKVIQAKQNEINFHTANPAPVS